MNPSFASGHVKNLSTVIIEEVTTFRGTLRKLAAEGKPFDMETKGAELIFDVIARIVYNFDMELSRQSQGWMENQKIYTLWDKPPLYVTLTARKS